MKLNYETNYCSCFAEFKSTAASKVLKELKFIIYSKKIKNIKMCLMYLIFNKIALPVFIGLLVSDKHPGEIQIFLFFPKIIMI